MLNAMKTTKPFKPFSSSMLERFGAYWNAGRFVLTSVRFFNQTGKSYMSHGAVFTLSVDDARELIDALQKFVAANE